MSRIELYYLNAGSGKVYLNVINGNVWCFNKPTQVSEAKLEEFLAIAKELGFKTGKL